MPGKSRPSSLKREREFKKRQRQQKKAERAALKSERRRQSADAPAPDPADEQAAGGAGASDTPHAGEI